MLLDQIPCAKQELPSAILDGAFLDHAPQRGALVEELLARYGDGSPDAPADDPIAERMTAALEAEAGGGLPCRLRELPVPAPTVGR
jgi:hypothetical protein